MNIMHFILLGLYILLGSQLYLADSCSFFENPYGNVTEDQDILVGSPFTFECTLFDTTMDDYGVTSSDLILRNEEGILTETESVGLYTVKYTVKNATKEDSGMYSCLIPIPNYDKPQLVCSSIIGVDYPPQNVTDFNCISIGFANLTCTWQEPHNNVHTRYFLHDLVNDNPLFRRKCPIFRPGFCEFRLDTKPPYIQNQKYLSFMLEGINSLGTSKQYFRLKHDEIIKPDIPKFVRFSEVRETSVVINISVPKGMEYKEFNGDLEYIVNFYPTSFPWKTKVVSVRTKSSENAVAKVVNLIPNTTYRFEVTCHVITESGKDSIRSEAKNETETTKADVPYFAPVIERSSFSSKSIAGNRSITLYWKPVSFEFENGKDFGYIIEYHDHFVPTRYTRQAFKKSNRPIAVNNVTSYTIEHMDSGTATIFTIVAVNVKGASSNRTAVMVVDKTEKLLDGARNITVLSYNRGEYDISWEAPDEEHYNFTLFWCELLKYGKDQCKGPVEWMQVFNDTHKKLYFPNHYISYRFGVAVNRNYQTSGIYWSSCTAFDDTQVKATSLEVYPKTSTNLQIKWMLRCAAYEKLIKEFYVYYCPCIGNCSYDPKECKVNGQGIKGWHKRKVDPSAEKVILSDLNPYTCYVVTTQALTRSGWGDYSPLVKECTMPGAPDDPPSNVSAVAEEGTIKVWFEPPTIPNGRITRYVICYNKTTSPDENSKTKEVRMKEDSHGFLSEKVVLDNVYYYTNYSIEVTACVDQACSVPSQPVFVSTDISYPGIITVPRVEMKEGIFNISWDPPLLPNGPIQYYEIKLEGTFEGVYNVSGQNFLILDQNCAEKDDNITEIQVRAINFKNGVPLFGEYGGRAETILCPSTTSVMKTILIVALCLLLGSIGVGVAGYLIWEIRTNAIKIKNTNIQLPKGLQSPLDNPLNSYDKFKSGLMNNQDSGIPNDQAYDRLFSSTSDGDLSQNAEENRGPSGRNHSGESATSDKVHNSISSANTTKTHNSMDSGAEVESPLSPDSFSSDSGSVNAATPNRANQTNFLISKDSGLEKEDNITTNLSLQSKCKWWKDDKLPNDPSIMPPTRNDEDNYNFIDKFARYNSVPSLVDFSVDNEAPICSGMQPYSKFGVGRSLSHGDFLVQNQGYSKFGFPNPSDKPQNIYYQPQIFSAFIPNKTFPNKEDPSVVKKKPVDSIPKEAYSKFGVVETRPGPDCYMSLNNFVKVPCPSQKTLPSLHAGVSGNGNCANAPYVRVNTSEPLEEIATSSEADYPTDNLANAATLYEGKCNDLSDVLPPDFDKHFIALHDLSKTTTAKSLNPEKDTSNNQTGSNLLLSGGGLIGCDSSVRSPKDGSSQVEENGSSQVQKESSRVEENVPSSSSESESESPGGNDLPGYSGNDAGRVLVGYVGISPMTGDPQPCVIPQPNLTNVSVESV